MLSSPSQDLLIGEILRRAAHRSPDRDALICDQDRCTYNELQEKVSRIAGWLKENGIRTGDKVGLLLENGNAFVEIFFAICSVGAVVVPINYRLSPEEVAYIVDHSDCRLLFINGEYQELVQSIRNSLPQVEKMVWVGKTEKNASDDEISYEVVCQSPFISDTNLGINDDEACMIVYTSGTTGRPKGAVISHKNLYQNGMNMIWEYGLKYQAKQLLIPPLFHVGAISMVVNLVLVTGTTVIQRRFDPVEVLQAVEEEEVNFLYLIPTMWNRLLNVPHISKYDLSSVTHCVTGAEICPIGLKKNILHHFYRAGLFDVFGQTEMSPCTTCLKPEDTLRKFDSVGKAVINVEVRVVDEVMMDVPTGDVGEIVYRGPTVMKEYYKNPEATEEAFRGRWFHSGDLVKVDEEGFIFVVDRKKDMIISGGENIYPAEVEKVLYSHPDIVEAAVVGVPDDKWGEAVKAVVCLKPGSKLTQEELIEYCKSHLASYKKPKIVEFVEKLPRSPAGKVLKKALRMGFVEEIH